MVVILGFAFVFGSRVDTSIQDSGRPLNVRRIVPSNNSLTTIGLPANDNFWCSWLNCKIRLHQDTVQSFCTTRDSWYTSRGKQWHIVEGLEVECYQ